MHRQRGLSLIITLVILVVMTLSSVAMIITMRAGLSSAGNIAFRQAATRVADVGVRVSYDRVKALLAADRTALDNDVQAEGYYRVNNDFRAVCQLVADPITGFSPLTYDFTNANCAVSVPTTSNYQVYYVIHRMATGTGGCPGAGCAMTPLEEFTLTTKGTKPQLIVVSSQFVYYRVTVKVVGPRNNNRYVQAFIY